MNVLKLTLAAAAVAFGSTAAFADLKAPPFNAVSSERTSVDQVGVGRLVESRVRNDSGATDRFTKLDRDLAQNDFHGQRDTVFGD